MPLPTAEEVRSIFVYEPETGLFRNRYRRGHNAPAGAIAGTPHSAGYWALGIKDVKYLAHRIAYLYMTGEWPPIQIDHRDLNRRNNAWTNLRPANQSEQEANKLLRSDNKTGVRGVCWDNRSGSYLVQLTHKGKRVYYKNFSSLDEAAAAYKAAASVYFKSFARDAH